MCLINWCNEQQFSYFQHTAYIWNSLELSPRRMIGHDFEMLWGVRLKIMGRDHGCSRYKNDNFSRTISDFHNFFLKKKGSIRLKFENHVSFPLSFFILFCKCMFMLSQEFGWALLSNHQHTGGTFYPLTRVMMGFILSLSIADARQLCLHSSSFLGEKQSRLLGMAGVAH